MKIKDEGTAKMSLNSISSLFSDSWSLFTERFEGLMEIMLVPLLVLILGYILLVLGRPFSFLGGLVIPIGYIVLIFSSLAVVFSVHHGTNPDSSYKGVTNLFWPFVWLAILETLATWGGFAMLIVPGIFLAIALTFVTYVLVVENRRGMDALRQSKDYVKGYWWAVLGRILLLGIILMAISFAIEFSTNLFFGNTVGAVVYVIVAFLTIPYSVVYNYKIFENLRILKPELAATQTTSGKRFLITSAILGIVAPILLFVIIIAMLIKFG